VITLESRPPNIEGQGEIRIRELVRNALRMRPDRIIVGEVRGAETLDMLQAMNTGHEGSLTTIHANAPRDALARLGPEADVWHIGTHMREWAAPDVWDELHCCYGRFDAEDSFAAFQATLSLFSKLSRRVAASFGLDHPDCIEDAIRLHVATLPDL